ASAESESGDFEQAIQDFRQLLALEPWREETHRDLMRVLAQNGQRGAALAQFELCRQTLKAGLDVEPTAETWLLVEQIKAGEIESEPQPAIKTTKLPANNLHPAALSFIGRESESNQVNELLDSDRCSLLTITGPGGIGKTRLANECAQQLMPHFEDGVFLVQLVGLSSADLLPTSIATAIGLALHGNRTPQQQLVVNLSSKKILLILDNFEHLLEGIDLLTELITAAPHLKLLVTSREPLGLATEWVLPLVGLPHAAHLNQPSAQLFTNRAQRLDLSFVPENEADEIGRICWLVEGMPLAIELAAAWIRVISCSEIAAEIERNLDFLATDLDLVPTHQRSIRAVFTYSWSLLPQEAQQGFAKLAIFRGGFTRESAAQVAGVSLRTLTTLVDKSLLQKQPGGRFHIHPLLRQFGLEQLSLLEKEAVSNDHAAYFATLLPLHESSMYSSKDPELLELVQSEIENIRAIWGWLTLNRSRDTLIQQLIPVTGYYFQRRNLFHEGLSIFEKLLAGQGKWQPESKAQALVQAAAFDCQLSRFDVGEKRLNQAIPILQQADQIESAAEGFYFLGIIHCRKGDYPQAVDRLNACYSLFNTLENDRGRSRAANIMGIVAATEGRYAEAEASYRASLDLQQLYGYQRGVANVLSNLGSVYGRQHQYEKALNYYQEAALIAKQVDETMATAVISSNLGSVSRSLKNYADAIAYYEESLKLTLKISDQRWVAANYNGLGLTFFECEQYPKAIHYLEQGFLTALTINALPDALTALAELGRVAAKLGQFKMAAAWLSFVLNQPETPAMSRQQAKHSIAQVTEHLTETDKRYVLSQSATLSLKDIPKSIRETFKDEV
ncbi:MAG: putative ATPase/Flp pilus assembly protein TadD, partial [Cellvibrionaceae bacterium]